MKTTTRFLGPNTTAMNKSPAYVPPRRRIVEGAVELTKREVALTLLDWQEKSKTHADYAQMENAFLYEQGLHHVDVRHIMAKFSRSYP